MRIAVAGGTGLVGTLVVAAARAAGHEVSVLARAAGVDLLTGQGLDLTGVEAVIDVANLTTTSRKRSVAFFEATTKNLLAACTAAGVGHYLVLSIVGIDRVDFGYYFGKRVQEELALASSVPTTVLRATQFHEFAQQVLDRPGPICVVPRMRSQPVAAREVADHLLSLVPAPQGRAPELAGPEVLEMPDLVRQLVKASGTHRRVAALKLSGAAGKAMAGGGLLPLEDGPRGSETFAAWLARAKR